MLHAHDGIHEYAVAQLREDHRERQDPHGLLAEPFTMTELRRLHEVALGVELQPNTFRRAMVGRLVAAQGTGLGAGEARFSEDRGQPNYGTRQRGIQTCTDPTALAFALGRVARGHRLHLVHDEFDSVGLLVRRVLVLHEQPLDR